jgi:3-hydroxyisobutyrate dehydrogenase
MATIGFIGLGNMGGPMARNLLKAGHKIKAFDIVKTNLDAVVGAGGAAAKSAVEAVKGAEIVITMLPAGEHVRSVYVGDSGMIAAADKGALLIDCSTIDVESARAVAAAAAKAGFSMLDAPVSGGVTGAEAATLTFMVGGPDDAFQRGLPVLQAMGKNIVHAGAAGNGQAAKICNNMILGVAMIAVSEGFLLAEKLGLDAQKLFDIASKSSGQCWAMTNYCPVPGPVPNSPANRNYKAGFTTAMMLKDLVLAQRAAAAVGVATPMGALAQSLQSLNAATGHAGLDFSSVINMLRGKSGGAGLS